VKAIGHAHDILIAISTSGNSKNVVSAIAAATEVGMRAVVLTGKSGGMLQSMVDCINIPSDDTARIQECHILVGHMICGMVEAEMLGDKQRNG
jgi:D-sedoheptulose 7-phosphate isomerase